MARPRQVRKQAEQAEQLHQQAYGAEDAVAPAEEPPAAEPAPEPKPQPEPVVAEPAPEPAPEPEPEEDWQQKYRVLQGKYNAEVPRMARELRDLRGELESQTQILAGIEQMRADAPEPAPVAPAAPGTISEAEREDYGADFLDVVGRQAQAAVAPQLEALQRQLQQMNQGMGSVAQRLERTDQEKLFDYLDRNVPDWRQLNDDDAFLTWLEQRDRYTGQPRRALLAEAYKQHDAPRVAAFFTGYQDENAAVTPAPADPPRPQNGSGKVPLTQLVAPGTSREGPGAAGAQDGKRTWTQAQIAAFYREVQQGRYRDDPAGKLAVEKDLVAAASEGRIIG